MKDFGEIPRRPARRYLPPRHATHGHLWHWCTALAASVAMCQAHACEKFELVMPTRFSTLADRQPILTWHGDSNLRYRVQVAAVLPESRVVAMHDTEVLGNRFQLPAPLPIERASIKVQVSRVCEGLDAQDLHALGPWFFVDTRPSCALEADALVQTPTGLRWRPVARAGAYRLRLFNARDGLDQPLVPLPSVELAEPQWMFTAEFVRLPKDETPWVATVQAVCDGIPGRPSAYYLRPL